MAAIDPIIRSFISEYAALNDLHGLKETTQFEHLVGHLLFARHIHGRFKSESVVTGDGETGIDGAGIILNGNLMTTKDDVAEFLKAKPSSSVQCTAIFFQAKLSPKFQREPILGFGEAVVELLQVATPETPQSDSLMDLRDAFQEVVGQAAKLDLEKSKCVLFYATPGEWNDPQHPAAALRRVEDKIRSLDFFSHVSAEPVDKADVRSLWANATKAQEATLPTRERLTFPPMEGIGQAFVCLVDAKSFVDEIIRDKSGAVRAGIFDQNIRDFEGLSNPVNARMERSLTDDSSRDRFGVMNNGVTIIAKEISPASTSYILRDYQIVNGCQTSNVLERCRDKLTDNAVLQVRLIQTETERVLNDVVEATNSQTAVPQHQFVANTAKVVEIQDFFKVFPEDTQHRLYFERRKSEFAQAGLSSTRTFSIPDLVRAYGATILEKAHVIASAPNQAYLSLADNVFLKKDFAIAYYVAAFAYYRMFNLKYSGKLKTQESRLFWHVLPCAKRIANDGEPMPNARTKVERYCKRFYSKLCSPSDALALFEESLEHIRTTTTDIDRNRLRRSVFTQEYLDGFSP